MFNRDRARELIKDRGRTREWVASQACVETDTITAYLNGKKQPSPAVVRLLAMALEVNETELIDQNKHDKKTA